MLETPAPAPAPAPAPVGDLDDGRVAFCIADIVALALLLAAFRGHRRQPGYSKYQTPDVVPVEVSTYATQSPSERDSFRQRRSPTLISNPSVVLDPAEEIERYLDGLDAAWRGELEAFDS